MFEGGLRCFLKHFWLAKAWAVDHFWKKPTISVERVELWNFSQGTLNFDPLVPAVPPKGTTAMVQNPPLLLLG